MALTSLKLGKSISKLGRFRNGEKAGVYLAGEAIYNPYTNTAGLIAVDIMTKKEVFVDGSYFDPVFEVWDLPLDKRPQPPEFSSASSTSGSIGSEVTSMISQGKPAYPPETNVLPLPSPPQEDADSILAEINRIASASGSELSNIRLAGSWSDAGDRLLNSTSLEKEKPSPVLIISLLVVAVLFVRKLLK